MTDIAVHPEDMDVLISSGKDGFVQMLNSRLVAPPKTPIFQDSSIFTSLAVDYPSGSVVITSEEGKVWTMPLPSLPPSSPIFPTRFL